MNIRKFKTEVEVAIVKEKKNSDGSKTIPVRYNVKGMMNIIKRSMKTKEQQDLLDEYAKFWLLDRVGVKTYPLEK